MASIETPTKIALISKALILLGEKPANSLSENRYGVTVMANLFELQYESELQNNGHGWHFARAKKALSRLNSTPLNEYSYVFQLPSDCLLPVGSFPSTRYEIYGDHVYANVASMDLEYKFKPDVSEIPSYFSLLMVFALARVGAKAITESDATANKWEGEYDRQYARSQFADAQGRPNKTTASSPFTQVR